MNLISAKKTTIKQNLAIIAGLFALIVTLMIYFILFPAINSIIKIRAEILTLKIEIEQNIQSNTNINKVNEKFDIVAPQIDKLNQVFINRNREVEFITALEGIAALNNVNQQLSLDPATALVESAYKKIPISINAQGSFNNILNYLLALESSNYYINIDNIDIDSTNYDQEETRQQNTNNAGTKINLRISGFTYWQ